jgi:mannan endo-1,4-beta-mannosidase
MFTRWKRWRHSRHSLLLAGLCLLTVMVTLDSSKSAVASSSSPSAVAGIATLERSAVASRLAPNGQSRRVIPRRTPPAPPSGISLIPSGPGPTPGAPLVTSLSPDAVSAGGGATVIINGSGFSAASAVYFGPNETSQFSVLSPTTITATAPANAGGVGVSVTTPLGSSQETQGSQLSYMPTGQLPITVSGQNLDLAGVAVKFTGVDAYELATEWGTNHGCGGMETPLEIASLFSSLAPNSLVRFWAFQGDLATDPTTHEIDWAPIDEIFYLAAQYHVYLIPTITDQGGTCDGSHWQDLSWFSGGYKDVFDSATNSDGSGDTSLSYWTYMQELVNRYKNSPALGMWEPISEAEASTCAAGYQPLNCSGHQTCPNESAAAADLTSFFDSVGGEIHTLDPGHLVEEGLLGGSQCGMVGADYEAVGASPGIDVLSVHDYYGPVALGGDQSNGLAERFSQATALDKPIITGEAGIMAGSGPGCETFPQRTRDMETKMQAQFAAGSSAFLVWNWVLDPLGACSYNTGPGDPLMAMLSGGASPS